MMRKIFLIILIIIAVIGIGLFIFLGFYTDRVIDPYVRSLLEVNKPMNHRIEYKDIKVNLVKRFIRIKEVRLYPDSGLVKEENPWLEAEVSTIRLTGFKLRDLLFNKALVIGDLVILKPSVVIHLPVKPPHHIMEKVRENTVGKQKSPLLRSVSLDKIMLVAGTLRLMHGEVIIVRSPDINFLVEQICVAKNSQDDPIGYTYGELRISLSDIIFHPESGLYNMSLKSFVGTKHDSTLVLNGFQMIPKYDKKEFSNHLKFQDDRFDVTIGRMEIKHKGLRSLLDSLPFHISSLKLDSVNADIYRDKNVAFNVNRFPQFYNESFLKIPIPLYIDTLEIMNSRLQYGELVPERSEAGIIVLEDFNLQSYGLTNQVAEDTLENNMQLNIQAKVMGEGNLNAELILPLEGDLRTIECSGSVGAMKLSPLNSMLEPSINMKFNDGKVDRMTFFFNANDHASNGWMEFLYQDLNVELLKKEPEKQWGFVSMLANTMTLSNNPAPGKDLKIVSIGYERDKNKGLINYVWKTIQGGMVHTILPIKKYQINRKSSEKEKEKGKKK